LFVEEERLSMGRGAKSQESPQAETLIDGLQIAALIPLSVLVLWRPTSYNPPFAGSVRVESEAFKEVLKDIQ
jgi:hypothetical protein